MSIIRYNEIIINTDFLVSIIAPTDTNTIEIYFTTMKSTFTYNSKRLRNKRFSGLNDIISDRGQWKR